MVLSWRRVLVVVCGLSCTDASIKRKRSLGEERWREHVLQQVKLDVPPGVLEKQALVIITADTREITPGKFWMLGVQGNVVMNVGAAVPEPFFFSLKPRLFKMYLDMVAPRNPDMLVVFVDSLDVVFGGCKNDDLLNYYKSVRRASGGAPIIFGAEFYCMPYRSHCLWYQNFTGRRRDVLRAHDLDLDIYRQAANCSWCAEDAGHDCSCSTPPTYQFLNSGFAMGPARVMHRILNAWQLEHNNTDDQRGTDQFSAQRVFFANSNIVALDYTGTLAVNLAGWNGAAFRRILEVRQGLVYNHITQRVQCFIHGSGPSKELLGHLLDALNKSSANLSTYS